jgi:acyl-coenzyme A synthetase/AMP-(fatty) acid ligase
VAEAAVVGAPDPDRTERVVAFVTLAPGHDASGDLVTALQDHVKATSRTAVERSTASKMRRNGNPLSPAARSLDRKAPS